jgi:hypothetical protein
MPRYSWQQAMREETTSLFHELPAPWFIRWIGPLHRLWRQPVVQRNLWYGLRKKAFNKYRENPGLYLRRQNIVAVCHALAGLTIAALVFMSAIPLVPVFQRDDPITYAYALVNIIVIALLAVGTTRGVRSPRIPLAVKFHDMLLSDKPDAILSTPLADGEIVISEVFSYSVSALLEVFLLAVLLIGYLAGIFAGGLTFLLVGREAVEYVAVASISGLAVFYFIPFTGLYLVAWELAQVRFGMRMPLFAAQALTLFIGFVGVFIIIPLVASMIANLLGFLPAQSYIPAMALSFAGLAVIVAVVESFLCVGVFRNLRRRR